MIGQLVSPLLRSWLIGVGLCCHSTRNENHMQRCAPEVKGDKPGRVVFTSNSSLWKAEPGGSEALGPPGLQSKIKERDGKCWLGALQI